MCVCVCVCGEAQGHSAHLQACPTLSQPCECVLLNTARVYTAKSNSFFKVVLRWKVEGGTFRENVEASRVF